MISAAQLLRQYHDASDSFLLSHFVDGTKWQLPCREPREVICHSDFAPYNVVFKQDHAVALIDFDTCHPGPRIWDLVYALYRWSLFKNPNNLESFRSLKDQRAGLFCQAYGINDGERSKIIPLMIERLSSLIDFIIARADAGDETCKMNLQAGHHLTYLADMDYIHKNKVFIKDSIIN